MSHHSSPLFEEMSRTSVWSGRSFFSVEELRIRSTVTGREFDRFVVRHPGAVGVVALDGDDVILLDEWRAPFMESLIQIPAGKLDVEGEEPLVCAQRELVEEIGRTAERWTPLATFAMTPGFCDEVFHLFLAEGITAVDASPQGDEEEQMVEMRVALDDVPAMIADGRIRDAKTIIGLLLTRERLGYREN